MTAEQMTYALILVYRNKITLPLAVYHAQHTTRVQRDVHTKHFTEATQ
jgi:hypothetical protein